MQLCMRDKPTETEKKKVSPGNYTGSEEKEDVSLALAHSTYFSI